MKKITYLSIFATGALAAAMGISLVSGQSPVAPPTNQEAFVNAAESTINGVVSVKSYATPRQQQYMGNGGGFFDDPFFEYFFGGPRQQPRQQQPRESEQRQIGLGSGVIISADGYIVTNNHVIADAERLEVTLNDNRNYNATVIGATPPPTLPSSKSTPPTST